MNQIKKDEIESQISKRKTDRVSSIILLVIGLVFCLTLILIIPGIIFVIMGLWGISKANKTIDNLSLELVS